MMLATMNDQVLSSHLLVIANDGLLRQSVHEHLGEYCHQFRNRLNSLKLCLYLAKRQSPETGTPALDRLEDKYADLERSIDRIQMLCRPMPVSLTSLGLDLLIDDRSPGWLRQAANGDVEVECRPPIVRAVARFDPDRMGLALDTLVGWRLSGLGPGSSAYLTWRVDRGRALICWEETSCPGSPASPPDDPSLAWSLPLITRIVNAHGGELRTESGDRWRVELEWPAVPDELACRTASSVALPR